MTQQSTPTKQVAFDVDAPPVGYDRSVVVQKRNSDGINVWRDAVRVCYRIACRGAFPNDGEYVGRVGVTLAAWGSRGDVDNLIKEVMDALTGVAYRDDSQVVFGCVTLPERQLTGKGKPFNIKSEQQKARITVSFYDDLPEAV